MSTVQLGPFIINGQMLLTLCFGAAGWLALRYRLRNKPERNLILTMASNAFFLWIVIWKGSVLFFDPVGVIQQPVSLLFFDGGERGQWIASLIALAYVGYRSSKQPISVKMVMIALITFFLAGWLACQLVLLAFGEGPFWYNVANAGLTALFLLSLLTFQETGSSARAIQLGVWFSIGNVLLLFMDHARPLFFISFSEQQLVFLALAVCFTTWSWFDVKSVRGG
ncbi:hypothetical protein M5X11_21885 [Paenibacillus alginolyticus]|uniref:hypothetical protein n=1 Tax=Paenibacillus alginolyticus TaxID=59839 RepID=UPI000FD8D369|nr:hypothetical protein [Paenibacillus alginolyticus]MCY9667534.1 hypothetical protein [Paenibacillus alginolyticus]